MQTLATSELSEVLKRQKYQIIGRHSASKKCRWLHKSLIEDKPCYKQRFYGIQSHRCIQMTPTLDCNMRCKFCWRIQPDDFLMPWILASTTEWDEPAEIVQESIKAQRKILSGYKGQVIQGKVDRDKYREASEPRHVAISLDGEPTFYPFLSSLIHEYRKRELTVFLVTNGTNPHAIEALKEEPSQLYVSLSAPDESTFITSCKPSIPDAWNRLMRTLSILPSLSCPTAIRITLVRGLNLKNPRGYARLLDPISPTYVEPKSYMYVGWSRRRLTFESMPSHQEIVDFSKDLAQHISYKMIDESPESRVALLSELERPKRLC